MKINFIKVVIWLFVLLPSYDFYFSKPTPYWWVILIIMSLASLYMGVEKNEKISYYEM